MASPRVVSLHRSRGVPYHPSGPLGESDGTERPQEARASPAGGSLTLLPRPGRQMCVFMKRTPDSRWLTQVRRKRPPSSSSLCRLTAFQRFSASWDSAISGARGQPARAATFSLPPSSRCLGEALPIGLAAVSIPGL